MLHVRTIVITLLAACAAGPTFAADASDIQVIQRWKLPGAELWDYLTFDSSHRLFVSHGTRVDVVSTDSGQLVGAIPDTLGVHGIALAKALRRGFTSNGKSDSITMFDLDSLKVIQQTKIPAQNPDAILYEPVGKHVFTFNGKSKNVTVLDASTLAVVTTLPVPDKPEFAVDDAAGQIYVNIESDPGQMVVIDSRKLTIKATWPLPGCNSPSGLTIDRVHHRLFSVCDDKVMAVTNATNGASVARVPIGDGPDAAAYDARRSLVFSSNSDGTLTVVKQSSPDHYNVIATVPTQRNARTMALDPSTGKVYLVAADLGPTPAATADQPKPKPLPIEGSFTILVAGRR